MRVSNVPLSSRSVSTRERPSGPLPAPTASTESAARTLFAPYELPVGVVLSLAGGPFFLWLLFRKGRGHP